jgi:hypothetical protein
MSNFQTRQSHETASDLPAELAPDVAPAETSVSAHLPWWAQVYHSTAFALSALLSPYLVIPIGTVGIVATQSASRRTFVLWTFLSVLFSTVIPAIYVLVQIARGKITDVHVMEREQRGGPFAVAVVSVAIGALVLRSMGAPAVVWGIGMILLVNGLVLSWITSFWKISMHVAVLSSVVIACSILIPDVGAWRYTWLAMIPALMWARATRGRHSIWQGVAGFLVSGALTAIVFYAVRLWPTVQSAYTVCREYSSINHRPLAQLPRAA